MPSFGKAILAIVFAFLVPGSGLVYLGATVPGSLFVVSTIFCALLGVFLPAALSPTAAAWAYDLLFVVTVLLWIGQFVLTLRGAVALRQGTGTPTRLPMAVAVVFVVTALVVSMGGIRARHGVAPFVIPTGSMKPTIEPGDRMLVLPLPEGVTGPSLRGKMVVHRLVEGNDPNGILYVKRVVAAGKDHVKVGTDCSVLVNGKPVPPPAPSGDAPYTALVCTPFDETLADRALYLLGDNRDYSRDSRHHGVIEETSVVGLPYVVFFSKDLKRIGRALD